MADEPFIPIANPSAETKIETTWGVLDNLRKEIAWRDEKIADLLTERDALIKRIGQQKTE